MSLRGNCCGRRYQILHKWGQTPRKDTLFGVWDVERPSSISGIRRRARTWENIMRVIFHRMLSTKERAKPNKSLDGGLSGTQSPIKTWQNDRTDKILIVYLKKNRSGRKESGRKENGMAIFPHHFSDKVSNWLVGHVQGVWYVVFVWYIHLTFMSWFRREGWMKGRKGR